ncbi:hypothetical protein GCM10010377_76580 [Streptomyces viridiviolaceus]|nr:hypothetical protein GCM10010377_76580 [Streptomyces viridiviolaceus]
MAPVMESWVPAAWVPVAGSWVWASVTASWVRAAWAPVTESSAGVGEWGVVWVPAAESSAPAVGVGEWAGQVPPSRL